jgi:hypothetical protein
MVACYVTPGENKRKLVYKSHLHIWDPPTSSESTLTVYSGDVYRQKKTSRSLNDVTHHHMEDIMGHFALMQRFSRVNSFGQPCMKTQRISSGDVEHVRGMGISIQEMLCHLPTTFRLSSSMSGELTIWDHS